MKIYSKQKNWGGRSRGPNGELPDIVVQIDESLLRGRRKSRQGRMLRGDQNPSLAEINEFNLLHDDNDDLNPLRNYGRRIEGPWIFVMAECHLIRDNNTYHTKSVRLFHAERRDASTLIPLIRDNVEAGSTIWSEQWGGYSRISTEIPGINYKTVNHSVEFVATNGTHTQNIELAWDKLKLKRMRISRDLSSNLLESHLHEFMYRSKFHSRDGWILFQNFLIDAAQAYPI